MEHRNTRNLVPSFIIEKAAQDQVAGNLDAVCLFADISGFTSMTEELMKHGREAAEVLAEVLGDVFEPLVAFVYGHQGFITSFAGDAFLALFPGNEEATCLRALHAAHKIQRQLNENPEYPTPYRSFNFAVKIGMGDGLVEWGILSSDTIPLQRTYYFKGEAVDRATDAEKFAGKGDIIISGNACQRLKGHITTAPVSEDYLRLTSVRQEDLPPKVTEIRIQEIDQERAAEFLPIELFQMRARGEFRHVTTIFMGLANISSDQELTRLVQAMFYQLRQYGGRLAHLDFGDKGSNLLIFWGTPISFENDVERALSFLLDFQDHIRSENIGIIFKAGITYQQMYAGLAGSYVRSQYSCYGRGINLAARMMVKACWGNIWMDENTAKQAPRHFDAPLLDHFAFKGFERKIPVFQLKGRLDRGEARLQHHVLVGRNEEMTLLQNLLNPVFSGKFSGACVVYGEAGIGKSRLVEELKNKCDAAGPVVPVWFECPADEILREPFNPFIYFLKKYFRQKYGDGDRERKDSFSRALNQLLKKVRDPEVATELQRTSSVLGSLFGLSWTDSLYEQLDPPLRRENQMSAIENFLKAESRLHPIILQLENAQWLDAASLQLIKRLDENCRDYPVAFLFVSRSANKELAGFMKEKEKALCLGPLDTEAFEKFCEATLSGPVAPALRNLLLSRTGGNPFFIEQTLLYLKEGDFLKEGPDGWDTAKTSLSIPSDVQAVLIARFDRLSMKIKQSVQTASILGQEFEMELLSYILKEDWDDRDLTGDVKAAEKEMILQQLSELCYIFKHSMMRDAVYEMQLQSQRRMLHHRAAEALERIYADNPDPHLAKIAYHFEKAGNTDKAVYYLEKAADQARENYHNVQALTYYDRLIRLLTPDTPEEAWKDLKEDAFPFHQCEPDKKKMIVNALLKKGRVFEVVGEWERAEGIYLSCLRFAETGNKDKDLIRRVFRMLGWIRYLSGENRSAMKHLEKSLEMCRAMNDPVGAAMSLGKMGQVYYAMGEYEQAEACLQEDFRTNRDLDNKLGMSIALNNLGNVYRRVGDIERAMECYEEKLRLYVDKKGECVALGNIGRIYLERGDYPKALENFENYLKRAKGLGDRLMMSIGLQNLGDIHFAQGDFETSLPLYQRKLELSRKLGDKKGVVRALNKLGNIQKTQGENEEAINSFNEALAICKRTGMQKDLSQCLMDKAELSAGMGRHDEAQTLRKEGREVEKGLKAMKTAG